MKKPPNRETFSFINVGHSIYDVPKLQHCGSSETAEPYNLVKRILLEGARKKMENASFEPEAVHRYCER